MFNKHYPIKKACYPVILSDTCHVLSWKYKNNDFLNIYRKLRHIDAGTGDIAVILFS